MKRRNIKVRFWLGLAVAGVVLGLPAGAQATTTNVVPNPGFEQTGCVSTPVVCGWTATNPSTSMLQDTTNPHSGSASMSVECASPACDLWTGGAANVSTDPAFCAPIGPGAHQASFWYRDAVATRVGLGAAFYPTPDCTGSSSSAGFHVTPGGGWQQATGALSAPPGTQSALFSLEVSGGCFGYCNETDPCYCGIGATFDDVEVDGLGDTAPPSISSFSPTSGMELNMVTITGSNFAGATGVAFNGIVNPWFDVVSSTEIVTSVGESSTSGPISVITPFGTGISSDSFTVIPRPPDICCFEPLSGPVGTTVDIMGLYFTGATSVTFNGIADPNFVVNSTRDITAHVPAGATTGPITVTTPGGTTTSYGSFTVTAAPPTINSFTPASGPVGTNVDILGTSFTGASSVTFNGRNASFTIDSASELHATVPSGATTGPIAVTTANGAATSAASFLVVSDTAPIQLSARGYKVKGLEKVDLSWNGASGASFNVYRDGARIASVQATAYTDNVNKRGSGSYTYRVCAVATSVCSNEATVNF